MAESKSAIEQTLIHIVADLTQDWGIELDEPLSAETRLVADMEFACAPAIMDAMQERLRHPVFGYTTPSKELYDAILGYLRDEKDVLLGSE